MSDPFIGEIRMFGFNYNPRYWAYCSGGLLPISQNPTLYSLLGNMYGGDGRTTFALPDLRGRAPMSKGRHPGSLFDYRQGEFGGAETNTLTTAQMPAHSHDLNTNPNPANTANSAGNSFGGHLAWVTGTATQTMNISSIGETGGGQAIENRMPFLVVNFCLALQGIYPPRS